MKTLIAVVNTLLLSSCIQGGSAYSILKTPNQAAKVSATDDAKTPATSRRNLLRAAAALSAGALLGNINPDIALAADDVDTPVYFGVGVSHLNRGLEDLVDAAYYFVLLNHSKTHFFFV